jgi:hypothetical protein
MFSGSLVGPNRIECGITFASFIWFARRRLPWIGT